MGGSVWPGLTSPRVLSNHDAPQTLFDKRGGGFHASDWHARDTLAHFQRACQIIHVK